MNNDYITGYLNGLMNMTTSVIRTPSYIKVFCYDKESFKNDFCKNYKIKEKIINLKDTGENITTPLLSWLNNDKSLVESLNYWINYNIKTPKKIYRSDSKLIDILNQKQIDYYFLEDLFFMETNDKIYVFLLGNNE